MASGMAVFGAGGRGGTLTDGDGQIYIDFATGISVMNVGHSHPRVVKAIREQAERLVHSGGPVVLPEVYVRLAPRLCEIRPRAFSKKALLVNRRPEGVEEACQAAPPTNRPPALSN